MKDSEFILAAAYTSPSTEGSPLFPEVPDDQLKRPLVFNGNGNTDKQKAPGYLQFIRFNNEERESALAWARRFAISKNAARGEFPVVITFIVDKESFPFVQECLKINDGPGGQWESPETFEKLGDEQRLAIDLDKLKLGLSAANRCWVGTGRVIDYKGDHPLNLSKIYKFDYREVPAAKGSIRPGE